MAIRANKDETPFQLIAMDFGISRIDVAELPQNVDPGDADHFGMMEEEAPVIETDSLTTIRQCLLVAKASGQEAAIGMEIRNSTAMGSKAN